MARFAAIDIGSNAMRLRIVEVERGPTGAPGLWRDLAALRAPVRLGREVFLTGALTQGAIAQATEALSQFREAMDQAKVDQYRAVATSAVRESENADSLVERAYREAGLHVEVIEGIEEARLVQLAVRRRLALDDQCALLVDVGGGSTELTVLDRGEVRASQSLPMGTVRLLEAFLERDVAVDARHAELVDEYVERVLVELTPDLAEARADAMIATGGSTDTWAQLCPAGASAQPTIDVEAMGRLALELAAIPASERMGRYGLRADRADTLIPAARILLLVARKFGQKTIVTPGTGLRDGVLEDLLDRHFSRWNPGIEEDAITKACLRLGRRYHFDEAHGVHVAGLSLQLFDDLKLVHRLSARERLLLKAAAILHDIGDFIRYEGHHKHSQYIIEHSDIMGITPEERRVVANVARYHRKGPPDAQHLGFRELGQKDRATVRMLSSMLRIADALDREHRAKIKGLKAMVARGKVRLEVSGDRERELEMWTVVRKAELFKSVFDLALEVADAPPGSRKPGAMPTPDRD